MKNIFAPAGFDQVLVVGVENTVTVDTIFDFCGKFDSLTFFNDEALVS
jgi:hypothetical protein